MAVNDSYIAGSYKYLIFFNLHHLPKLYKTVPIEIELSESQINFQSTTPTFFFSCGSLWAMRKVLRSGHWNAGFQPRRAGLNTNRPEPPRGNSALWRWGGDNADKVMMMTAKTVAKKGSWEGWFEDPLDGQWSLVYGLICPTILLNTNKAIIQTKGCFTSPSFPC